MSTIKAANLQNTGSGAPTVKNSSGTEVGHFCKAWVNFNGDGTVAIRDDFNVSSITDNGTGLYTVNFTNSLANANYAWVGQIGYSGDNTNSLLNVEALSGSSNPYSSTTTTSLLKVETVYADASNNRTRFDGRYIGISIFCNN